MLGCLDANIGRGRIMFDGMNHIYAYNRFNIEQTKYVYVQYEINSDGKMEMLYPEEGYCYESGLEYTLLENLPVYRERNRSGEVYYISPQTVTFTRTDAKNWVEVLAEDGTSGWMYVETPYWLPDLQKSTSDVFEGLAFAG
jgi:hypothetical protein